MTMTHSEARSHIVAGFSEVFDRLPSTWEAQIVGGVAVLETGYGNWKAPEAVGSFNMGAITAGASWKDETFSHRDSRPDPDNPGKDIWYVTKFRKYPTAAAGFADLVRVVYKTNGREKSVLPEATEGDVYGVSAGLYATRYYTGKAVYPTAADRIAAHYRTLQSCVDRIAKALGETPAGKGAPMPRPVDPFVAPPTIARHRKNDPDTVKIWQRIVDVVADGKFGPITQLATQKWQRDHGLVGDGVVGPKTWRAALT